jgi:hypothetical protein
MHWSIHLDQMDSDLHHTSPSQYTSDIDGTSIAPTALDGHWQESEETQSHIAVATVYMMCLRSSKTEY